MPLELAGFGISIFKAWSALASDQVHIDLAVFQEYREREKDAESRAWIFLGKHIVHIMFVVRQNALGFREARLGVEATL